MSTPSKTINAAPYLRVSTEEQNSEETQEAACLAQIKQRGWNVYRTYHDHGFSAYAGRGDDRPAFQEMMADMRAGHIQAIVVYSITRLARRVMLINQLLEEFQKRGVLFVSVLENIDLSTPYGWAGFQMSAVWAELQSRITGVLTRERMETLAKAGYWVAGNVPFGYVMPTFEAEDGQRLSTRIIEPNNEHLTAIAMGGRYASGRTSFALIADWANSRDWPRIREAARAELAGGGSLMEWAHAQNWSDPRWNQFEADSATRALLVRDWRRRGFQQLGEYSVRSILDNYRKSYSGLITFNDHTYPGKHQAIVTPELAAKVLEMRTVRRRSYHTAVSFPRSWDSLLTSLAYCAVSDEPMWMNVSSSKYHAYMCRGRKARTCKAAQVRADIVEPALLAYLSCLTASKSNQTRIVRLARSIVEAPVHAGPRSARPSAGDLDEQLRRLKVQHMAGIIGDQEFLSDAQAIQAQRAEDPTPVEPTKRPSSFDIEKGVRLISSARKLFDELTIDEKRALLAEVFDRIWIADHQIIAIRATVDFEPVIRAAHAAILEMATPEGPIHTSSKTIYGRGNSGPRLITQSLPALWQCYKTPYALSGASDARIHTIH